MRPRVFVTRRLPDKAMRYLEENFDITINPYDRVLTREELLEGVKGVHGLLPLLTDKIDAEVMDTAGDQLKIISNYAVGFNNIDLDAASHRHIAVTNTPGVLTDTTADLTMALLLAVARRIVEADAFLRQGKFKGWQPLLFLGADLHHKTLGLIGLGRIGYAVAKRAVGFNMRILYYSNKRLDIEKEKQIKATFVDMETLLKESDFISLHVPLTSKTRHLIGEKELAIMKPEAFLINTSRGEVVDESALVNALKNNRIAGAGLDVFENEPEINPELINLQNTVLLPHIGSASIETRTEMGMAAARNLIAMLIAKKVPPNCLNPEIFHGTKE